MPYSYEDWEIKFLQDKALEYGFKNNHQLVFTQRFLLENIPLNNPELTKKLDEDKRIENYYPYKMIADSCNKVIYPKLQENGFDCKSENNPNGKYEKDYNSVILWLKEEVFPEYIKTIYPRTAIEIWHDLWEKAEENTENNLMISVQEEIMEDNSSHLGVGIQGGWNSNEIQVPLFSIGSKIKYEFNLNSYEYLIVVTRFASGEFYCLAPSNLSPILPVNGAKVSIPKDDVFTVLPPPGYEEILAVLCQDEPKLDWLPKAKDDPLELETNHLVDILDYVNNQNCQVMRYKYLVT